MTVKISQTADSVISKFRLRQIQKVDGIYQQGAAGCIDAVHNAC